MIKRGFLMLIAFICALFPFLSSCSYNKRYSETYLDHFDTVTTFTVYGLSKRDADSAKQLLEFELDRYHKLFDIYNTYDEITNIKTVNDNAGRLPVSVDSEIIDLLEYSVSVYNLTSGYVNVAMGSVLSIWHKFRQDAVGSPDSAELPDMEKLREAEGHTDIRNIVIDEEKGTVYINDPNMSIDVGAIAKGYSAQRIAERLEDKGYKNFVLSIGGNVVVRGAKEKGASWQAAIEDPADTSKNLCSIALSDNALVTSGSYQRYYTVDGERYHHIIDPVTLMPKNEYLSVSVICENSALADALSTAIFNMSLEDGQRLVESLDGVEVMWVTSSEKIVYSENFEDHIVK